MRFAHALIREALYEGIAGVRRRRVHRRAAEALAAAPHPTPTRWPTISSRRATRARSRGWSRAGERARRAYAWLTAAARFEAALALLDGDAADAATRGWLLLRLGRHARATSTGARACAYLDEALRLAAPRAIALLAAYALLHRAA